MRRGTTDPDDPDKTFQHFYDPIPDPELTSLWSDNAAAMTRKRQHPSPITTISKQQRSYLHPADSAVAAAGPPPPPPTTTISNLGNDRVVVASGRSVSPPPRPREAAAGRAGQQQQQPCGGEGNPFEFSDDEDNDRAFSNFVNQHVEIDNTTTPKAAAPPLMASLVGMVATPANNDAPRPNTLKNESGKTINVTEVKRGKGISRVVLAKEICHHDSLNTLLYDQIMTHKMNQLRSQSHVVYLTMLQKQSLGSFTEKRFFKNRFSSLAHGHYAIPANYRTKK